MSKLMGLQGCICGLSQLGYPAAGEDDGVPNLSISCAKCMHSDW